MCAKPSLWNFKLVLQKVKEDLNKRRDIPCSWIGRFGILCVCVCVMTGLSKGTVNIWFLFLWGIQIRIILVSVIAALLLRNAMESARGSPHFHMRFLYGDTLTNSRTIGYTVWVLSLVVALNGWTVYLLCLHLLSLL